jgi:hypothetical protein
MSEGTSTIEAMALYTVRGEVGQPPSLASAAAQLGVSLEDLDAVFGVVPVDPRAGVYAVQARSDRVNVAIEGERRYQGPYSSPKIVPFGPTRKTNEDD